MQLNLNQLGQIALSVSDVDRSEAFYERVIGLRKLYRFRRPVILPTAPAFDSKKPMTGHARGSAAAFISAAPTSP